MRNLYEPNGLVGDPRQSDPRRYVTAVYTRNEHLLDEVGNVVDRLRVGSTLQYILRGESPDEPRVHIATTGSDGRKEKKGDYTSPIEGIILVQRGSGVSALSVDVRMRCIEAVKALDIFGGIEVKDLDYDRVAYCQDYDPPTPWPTLVIDLFPLGFSNKELVGLSKELLFHEVVDPKGKSIVEEVKKRFKEYRNIAMTGKNRFKGNQVEHFNRDSGELFYDPAGDVKQGSVKYGPLRTVQMFLAYRILKFMRNNACDSAFIQNIPGNTEEKIAALLDDGALNLSSNQAVELAQLYQYFLWCFYLSEYCYSKNGGEKAVVVPDVKLFQENLDNLLKLVDLQK